MHDNERWQVFGDDGEPIVGKFAIDNDVSDNAGVGIAQLWVWRRWGDRLELLLQRRSLTKKRHPGYYGSSAGGHVNFGETFIEATVREAKEEIGIVIDPVLLRFVAEIRTVLEPNCMRRVYAYELVDYSWRPSFNDGEVSAVKWVEFERLKIMMNSPNENKLVNHGSGYFSAMIESFERL